MGLGVGWIDQQRLLQQVVRIGHGTLRPLRPALLGRLEIGGRKSCASSAVVGIEIDRALEHLPRLSIARPFEPLDKGATAQQVVIGVKVVGRCGQGAGAFDLAQLRREHAGHAARDLVLHHKDVIDVLIVALRPQERALLSVGKLHVDTQPLIGAVHAARDQVTHPKLTPQLLRARGGVLVGCDRAPRYHEQIGESAEGANDVLGHPVTEVSLLGVTAAVFEGKNGDRWPFETAPGTRNLIGGARHRRRPELRRPYRRQPDTEHTDGEQADKRQQSSRVRPLQQPAM